MIDEIKNHQTKTMNEMTNALKNSLYETVNIMTSDQEDDQLTANAVTIQSLQREIKDLKNIVAQLTNTPTPTQMQPRSKKKPRKYCWTHGWCAHLGADYKRAEGHKDEATLQNKMGGSTKYCPESR